MNYWFKQEKSNIIKELLYYPVHDIDTNNINLNMVRYITIYQDLICFQKSTLTNRNNTCYRVNHDERLFLHYTDASKQLHVKYNAPIHMNV